MNDTEAVARRLETWDAILAHLQAIRDLVAAAADIDIRLSETTPNESTP